MEKRYLKEIGFSEGEERVYTSLCKLGTSSITRIAQDSEVSRSKVYEILEKLVRKGIVSHFKKNNVSYFKASPPTRILEYIKEKELSLKKQREDFTSKIDFFEGLAKNSKLSPEAEVYEGMEGVKNVREIALNEAKKGDAFYYFGNPKSGHEYVLGYWDDWNARRVKKGISANIIYNQDAVEFGERRKSLPHTKVKYLPKKGNTHAWVEIYGDVIAIVLKKDTPMSIVIKNRLVAESFKMYFNIIWNASSNSV